MKRFINLMGQRFNRLIPIKLIGKDKYGNVLWLCKCDCGKEKIIPGYQVRNGRIKSCGCLKKERDKIFGKLHSITHGYCRTKTYNAWASMIQRCTNPNNQAYKNYGGRGIKICNRWLKFENFLEDVGEIPEGLTFDRINNNQGYFPNNWRLATAKEQNRNKRNIKLYNYNGKIQCMPAWIEEIIKGEVK